MKEFYWDKETVDHFRFASNYGTVNEIHNMVKEFVEIDCILGDGESENELIISLMNEIYE